jgi:dihydrofolate reductase
VPIFVLTREPPRVKPKQDEHLTITFVTGGIQAAIARAAETAGERAVMVGGGVNIAQQLLDAGLVDELRIDIMPVLLGAGLPFFGTADLEGVRLAKIGVREVGARTSLSFRVG